MFSLVVRSQMSGHVFDNLNVVSLPACQFQILIKSFHSLTSEETLRLFSI